MFGPVTATLDWHLRTTLPMSLTYSAAVAELSLVGGAKRKWSLMLL